MQVVQAQLPNDLYSGRHIAGGQILRSPGLCSARRRGQRRQGCGGEVRWASSTWGMWGVLARQYSCVCEALEATAAKAARLTSPDREGIGGKQCLITPVL